MIEIYGSNGRLKCRVGPGSSSIQDKTLQSDNVLTLSFAHYAYLVLDVNDYCDFMGERYWLLERYLPTQKSEREWEYNVKLYGIESLIKRLLVLQNSDGENDAVFTLTAPASEHVRLIVASINAGMETSGKWKVGSVMATENLTIDYEGTYCDEGLAAVAAAAHTEWWIEGETVNLCRCEHGEELALRYGESLLSLNRDEADGVKFYTRLFPIGSSRNIDSEKYGYSRLQLPDGKKYVDDAELLSKYGVIHHYEQDAFSGIYPRRMGVISNVRWEEVQDSDGNPFTIWYFQDTSLTFDPNEYEIAGLVKHVSFQSGELAGRDFEVNYNSSNREFEIITTWPYDDNTQLPDVAGGLLIPAIGNQYILWNIRMPDEYYGLAEAELLQAVEEYNREHQKDKSVYKAPLNPHWLKRSGAVLSIGRKVRLESEEYFPSSGYRSSRITRLTRKVVSPYEVDVEIGDALPLGTMDRIEDSIRDVKAYTRAALGTVPDLIRLGDETRWTDNSVLSALRTRREFVSRLYDDTAQGVLTFVKGIVAKAKSFFTGIENRGDLLNSGDLVNSGHLTTRNLTVTGKATFLSVEIEEVKAAGGMIVESPGSFCIERIGSEPVEAENKVSGETDSCICCYQRAKGADGHNVRLEIRPGDQLMCQTFNIDAGSSEQASNRYYWRRCLGVGTVLLPVEEATGEAAEFHYIYLSIADCDPSVANDIPAAGDKLVVLGHKWGGETDPDRQNAWVSSAYRGNDPYLADKAPYKAQYWGIDDYDLSSHLKTYFSKGKNYVAGDIDLSAASTLNGKNLSTTLSSLQTSVNAVREQSDKQMVIWFGNGVPSADKAPSDEWTDEQTKALHEKDVYYNRTQGQSDESGRAWSWEQSADGTWGWQELTDRDVLGALELASAAQTTADSKRRVFVAPPTGDDDEYDMGDLWVNATWPDSDDGAKTYVNDLLRCVAPKGKGEAFSIEHWCPAQEYTTQVISRFFSYGHAIGTFLVGSPDESAIASVLQQHEDWEGIYSALYGRDTDGNYRIDTIDASLELLKKTLRDATGNVVGFTNANLLRYADDGEGSVELFANYIDADGNLRKTAALQLKASADGSLLKLTADQIDFVTNGLTITNNKGDCTFSIDQRGNTRFGGTLDAPSGTIGGFIIQSNCLTTNTNINNEKVGVRIGADYLLYSDGIASVQITPEYIQTYNAYVNILSASDNGYGYVLDVPYGPSHFKDVVIGDYFEGGLRFLTWKTRSSALVKGDVFVDENSILRIKQE